ncbi:MAG: paraquat-inducible protein A [Magnetococcales bacterium]|nr:paraquat-inducible protein A [Magnetococcales bacterium]
MTLSVYLSACPHCDALHRVHRLPFGQSALCSRCGTPLYHSRMMGVDQPLAFALTGLLLFILANSFPLLALELSGRVQESTLLDGITALFDAGMWLLALLVCCTSLLFPLLILSSMVYLLLPLKLCRPPWPCTTRVLRALTTLTPWGMTGVYALGVMVAIVKLRDMATVTPGIALYAFFGLLLTTIAAQLVFDAHIRRQIFMAVAASHPLPTPAAKSAQESPPTRLQPTALRTGLLRCHTCTLLVHRPDPPTETTICPRCGDTLHPRKPASLTNTWALLLAAALFYIPANLLPVMTVIRFGQGEPDTILSGIQHLIQSGLWPLALLIFFASIVVPLMKLCILTFLLLSVHYHMQWRPRERTTLYRVIELFGHWSMVDIFLISILTALVQLGSLTTVEPGNGATFFGMVVVLTMLATKHFDPRLIWDALEKTDGPTSR